MSRDGFYAEERIRQRERRLAREAVKLSFDDAFWAAFIAIGSVCGIVLLVTFLFS